MLRSMRFGTEERGNGALVLGRGSEGGDAFAAALCGRRLRDEEGGGREGRRCNLDYAKSADLRVED